VATIRLERRRKQVLSLFVLAVFALGVVFGPHAVSFAESRTPVEIQLLNVSDWHAQIDPISVTGLGNVGGAAQIAAYWNADRAANPNTLTLTAGDAFGAAPPLSSFFDEEPAVRTLNLMGLNVDTFGNHNFDRGVAHLQRMIDLADYQYVSANRRQALPDF
jgi:5'-nucleotidase